MLDLLKKLAGPSNYVEDPDRKANKKLMLQAMRQVESRGGEDTNHDGDAIGDYGLRPIAIQDIYEKSPDLQQKYESFPDIMNAVSGDKLLQDDVARQYYDLLNKKAKDDPNAMAYGWLNGPQGLRRAQESEKDIANHWHVNKVKKEYKRFSDLEKATRSPLDFLKK
jgi:hypothetical protein